MAAGFVLLVWASLVTAPEATVDEDNICTSRCQGAQDGVDGSTYTGTYGQIDSAGPRFPAWCPCCACSILFYATRANNGGAAISEFRFGIVLVGRFDRYMLMSTLRTLIIFF